MPLPSEFISGLKEKKIFELNFDPTTIQGKKIMPEGLCGNLTDADLNEVKEAVKQGSLNFLSLKENSKLSGEAIASIVSVCPDLEVLVLDNIRLGQEAQIAIIDAVANHQGLKTVSMIGMRINETGISYLADCFQKRNKSLDVLNLSGNPVWQHGASEQDFSKLDKLEIKEIWIGNLEVLELHATLRNVEKGGKGKRKLDQAMEADLDKSLQPQDIDLDDTVSKKVKNPTGQPVHKRPRVV